jgi:hypothetical protein
MTKMHTVLIALTLAGVAGACSSTESPTPPIATAAQAITYSDTVGDVGAAIVSNLRHNKSAAQIRAAMASTKVIGGAEALALIADYPPPSEVKAALQQSAARAILLPTFGDGTGSGYLYVPFASGGEYAGKGFEIKGKGQECEHTCVICEAYGHHPESGGNPCSCVWYCQQVCCEGGTAGPQADICLNCESSVPANWTQDDLWSNPKPERYNDVEAIFGRDARFACKTPVDGHSLGTSLFDGCPK